MSDYKPYPPHTVENVGNKVSWYRFENQTLAEQGAQAAKHNANVMWNQGYDFGFMNPGDINKNQDGSFTVVVP